MNLYIAEKPSVAVEIAKALGPSMQRADGYIQVGSRDLVSWCVGHLLSQAAPEAYDPQYAQWSLASLPILPVTWQMEPNPRTKAQLRILGGLLKRASCVMNAGDAAREGQSIVDEVLEHFGYRGPAKRLWLREMNPPAIRAAIAAMRDNGEYRRLYASALARARADWLVGMNCTRGYTSAWQSRGNSGTLHIGRVQTPTLCLIVARDLAIEAFVPVPYFVLRARVKHEKGTFTATWQPPGDAPGRDPDGHMTERAPLEAIAARLAGKSGRIVSCITTPKTQAAPLPFSLGDLQKAANKRLGLSPSETLDIAQALYEKHKLTTYPRTDCSHLPSDEHGLSESIVEAVRSNFGTWWAFSGALDFSIKSAAWNTEKIGDHHAIRPTLVRNYDLKALTQNEHAVYRMIVAQFLAQFLPPYRYASTVVQVACEAERFRATGTVDIDPGWKVVLDTPSVPAGEDLSQSLPAVREGDACLIRQAEIEARRTSPPPRYDGATLIEAMEDAWKFVTDPRVKATIRETGIGTPATRAAIVEQLIKREYVEQRREAKRSVYVATARGRLLYQAVPLQLKTPDLTAYFEDLLARIERDEMTLDAFMVEQTTYVTKLVRDLQDGSVAAQMPTPDQCAPLVPAPSRTRASKASTRVSGIRTAATAASALTPQASLATSRDSLTCPKCGSPLRERVGRKGTFLACSAYPRCKHTSPRPA